MAAPEPSAAATTLARRLHQTLDRRQTNPDINPPTPENSKRRLCGRAHADRVPKQVQHTSFKGPRSQRVCSSRQHGEQITRSSHTHRRSDAETTTPIHKPVVHKRRHHQICRQTPHIGNTQAKWKNTMESLAISTPHNFISAMGTEMPSTGVHKWTRQSNYPNTRAYTLDYLLPPLPTTPKP